MATVANVGGAAPALARRLARGLDAGGDWGGAAMATARAASEGLRARLRPRARPRASSSAAARRPRRAGVRGMALDSQAPDLDELREAARKAWSSQPQQAPTFASEPDVGGSTLPATATEDTITAVVTATSPTQGGVAVVRMSGSGAVDAARRCFRTPAALRVAAEHGADAAQQHMDAWSPVTHVMEYGYVVDAEGTVVDEVLLAPMLAPRSFTAEDVVELQGHGGAVCPDRVLAATISAGARLARPGEFSLRAYLNGRLDLTQAEAVQRLIASKTSRAADAALAAARGGIADEVRALREALIDVLVEVEARIDFEEELPPLDVPMVSAAARAAGARARAAAATCARGRALESGIAVALVGRPNTGKSSLLNAWTGSDRSIVTELPGTTRDVVEAPLVMERSGVPVRVLDTAGIRGDTADVVEALGVERSRSAAACADAVLMVIDAERGWTAADAEVWESVEAGVGGDRGDTSEGAQPGAGGGYAADADSMGGGGAGAAKVLVINKIDLRARDEVVASLPAGVPERFDAVVGTSALTSRGMDLLEAALLDSASAAGVQGGAAWAVNARQGEALLRAAAAVDSLMQSIESDLPLDCWTVDLREAIMALGEVSGEEVKEEVLDKVFANFCIGK